MHLIAKNGGETWLVGAMATFIGPYVALILVGVHGAIWLVKWEGYYKDEVLIHHSH